MTEQTHVFFLALEVCDVFIKNSSQDDNGLLWTELESITEETIKTLQVT